MSARARKPPRLPEAPRAEVNAFRARHLALAQRRIESETGPADVTVDEAESPLAWLARRRGRDGRAMIEPHQLLAGERLRIDFTQADLLPRLTVSLTQPVNDGRYGDMSGHFTETMIGARQRVRQALDTAGPEFAGLLIDVCCFLKRLEDVERDRRWPARSAKVVLQLGLERLARHYGYAGEARGKARAPVRTWLAEDADPLVVMPREGGASSNH
jgi:hypothetical protein